MDVTYRNNYKNIVKIHKLYLYTLQMNGKVTSCTTMKTKYTYPQPTSVLPDFF